MFRRSVIITSILLLTACSTSVVEPADRDLPAPVDTQENAGNTASIKTVNVAKSLVAFVGSKGSAVTHEGKFNSFTATLQNPSDVATATLNITIDIASMQTDSDGLTSHLQADDYFDAATYPQATFTSSNFTKVDGGKTQIDGTLTIKGTSKDITLMADVTDTYLTTTYSLDRTQFNVGGPAGGLKGVNANVPVEIKLIWE